MTFHVENRGIFSLSKDETSSDSKPSLFPSCAVFPDGLANFRANAAPVPITPLEATPPKPSSISQDLYDYFQWTKIATPTLDISDPAPVGAIADEHSGDSKSATMGAWYAMSRGIQTPIGFALFPDHNTQPARRPRRPSSSDPTHDHRNSSCSSPCPYCSKCYSERRANSSSSPSGSISSSSSDAPHPECCDDDVCNHDIWEQPLKPCIVRSLRQPPPPPAAGDDGTPYELTAEMIANGTDIQGIPWDTLPLSRADCRANRLSDLVRNRDAMDYDGLKSFLKEPKRDGKFFDFFSNARTVKSTIVHFQLRNLAWATSKHDVYVVYDGAVMHWDAATKQKKMVFDLNGTEAWNDFNLGPIQVSTIIAKDDLVIAGGFYGEMIAKNVRTNSVVHNKRITFHDNAITNAIDIFDNTIMASNNDCHVRCFDIETFERKSAFQFSTPVNHATRQPAGKMVAVAGDDNIVQVIDGDSGDRIAQLRGHEHYSFATGWHPNGRLFATGSQDRTCQVWDARNMSHSVCVLGAHMGAVRSLRFSPCGRYMLMAEPRDFVHIYDVNGGCFDRCQEIDFFGEIAGFAMTPSSESLFIAISDRLYSGLLEYERRGTASFAKALF